MYDRAEYLVADINKLNGLCFYIKVKKIFILNYEGKLTYKNSTKSNYSPNVLFFDIMPELKHLGILVSKTLY